MRVSIGILAYNEERSIGGTLASLFDQSIFRPEIQVEAGIDRIQVCCIPNGCSDGTVGAIHRAIEAAPSGDRIDIIVVDLPQPGKSNAWNRFVHDISDRRSDVLMLMDADIILSENDTLLQLLSFLDGHAEVDVVTDVPVKSFGDTASALSIKQRVSHAASRQKKNYARHSICGQLYCGRSAVIRDIWMPNGLPVEDGFLSAFVKTKGLTEDPRETRVERVGSAWHYYFVTERFTDFIAHEARIVVGSVVNQWIFDKVRALRPGVNAGAQMRAWNDQDQRWLGQMVKERTDGRMWVIPRHFVLWRLAPLKGLGIAQTLRRLPLALASTTMNFIACVRANRILRSGKAVGHW